MLTGRKGLAKTSGKPGKTQLINHFLIDDSWYMVDLPGYGYAKTSKKNREAWHKTVREYLLYRTNLQLCFVLIDSRIAPQKSDLEFIRWLGEYRIPLALVFTKADKQSVNKGQQAVARFKSKLEQDWETLPVTFLSSSETGLGKTDLLQYIHSIVEMFHRA